MKQEPVPRFAVRGPWSLNAMPGSWHSIRSTRKSITQKPPLPTYRFIFQFYGSTTRNAIRTKPVFAEFYLFFLLLFCFRPGYILLFAHFIDRTFVAFYLGNELFTSTLYYPSISKRDACALNHSVLGTHYSVVLSTQWVLIPTPKCEPNRTTEPTEQQIRNESRRQEKVVSPPLSLFFSTALAAESGIRGERSLHSPTSLETWNDTKKGGSSFKTLIINQLDVQKPRKKIQI